MEEKKPNRVESIKTLRKMVRGFYDDVYAARGTDRMVAWCVGPSPYCLFAAQDISFVHLESYSAMVAGRKAEAEMIQAAEAVGFSPDVCSYVRIASGTAEIAKSGQEIVRGDVLLPLPKFVTCVPGCSMMMPWFDSLVRLLGVPSFSVNIRPTYCHAEFEENVEYLRRQLEELVVFLEDMTAKRFNWQRLRQLMELIKRGSELRRDCMDLCKNVPSPMSQFDWFLSLGPANVLRGRDESVAYWQMLKAELQDRVSKGIGAVPDERFRLYWDHTMAWPYLRQLSEFFAAHDANLVTALCSMTFAYADPSKIGLANPLQTIARELCAMNHTWTDIDYRIEQTARLVQEYRIDGLVMHAARTCRPLDAGQYDVVDAIKRKLGVPGVVIEGDHTDANLFSIDRWTQTLESFFDILRSKKQAVA